MIKKFTYRELTLLLGVVVAVIVVFTLWIRQPFSSSTSHIPVVTTLKKINEATKKNYVSAFEVLHSGRSNPY
jgi:hypothetical protein